MSQKPITAREWRSRCPVATSFCSREAIPKMTMRPNGARVRRQASNASPPLISSTASTSRPVVGLEDRRPRSSARESTVASAPSRAASSRFSSLEASAITRPPARLASCTASVPVPPAAASTTTVSPGWSRAQRWTSACAVSPWSSSDAA